LSIRSKEGKEQQLLQGRQESKRRNRVRSRSKRSRRRSSNEKERDDESENGERGSVCYGESYYNES